MVFAQHALRSLAGALSLCVLTMVRHAPAQAEDPRSAASVSARLERFMARAALHGASGTLLVARGDTVLFEKSYGRADRATGLSLTNDSPYFIGSVAKQFTAAAILSLAAAGRLSISDSIKRFFPDAPPRVANITLRELLSHASGLPYLPTRGLFGPGTRDSVMREMLAEPIESAPGTYAYSSVGFILLAGVVERASGESYEAYLTRLFDRAGLRGTGFIGDSARWGRTTTRSYSDGDAEPRLGELPAFPRMVGAGSIVSTVPDLYRWYRSLTEGRLIPPALRDSLFAKRVEIRPGSAGGFAWTIATLPTGQLRLIAGDIAGYSAEIRHYVDERLVVVFASNRRTRGHGDREIVMNTVARVARGDSVVLPPMIGGIRPNERASFVGRYDVDGGGSIIVNAHGDSLALIPLDRRAFTALQGADSATRAIAAEIDASAMKLLRFVEDSTAAVGDVVDPSVPADAAASLLRDLRTRATRARGATLLGSKTLGADATSYLRLTSPADSARALLALNWRRGRLTGITWDLAGTGVEEMAYQSPTTAVAFDLLSGRLVELSLGADDRAALRVNGASTSLRRIKRGS